MSMAIQRSKYTGDPGIGSFLKGIARVGLGIASQVPVFGGVAKVASGYLFPPTPGTTTYAQMPYQTAMPNFPTGMPGSGQSSMASGAGGCGPGMRRHSGGSCIAIPGARQPINLPFIGPPGMGIDTPLGRYGLGEELAYPNGGGMFNTAAMQAGKPCPISGYHWNKSGYFLKSGEWVPAGTRMVRNRRRNPANPRATSNAIMRIKGAKRYAKSLSSISIRKKC